MNPKKLKSTVTSKVKASVVNKGTTPIVCISKSACGLEALEQVFGNESENI